jgi:uncharacterized protein YndB with AHSA1/START domain
VIEAQKVLLSPREDVWGLISEPYHLPDWWPAYSGVQPDRRGLAVGARWQVIRLPRAFYRRPDERAVIIISRVERGRELSWQDLGSGIECGIRLENAGTGRTQATLHVAGPSWRIWIEGARGLPENAAGRLYDLCQTAAGL